MKVKISKSNIFELAIFLFICGTWCFSLSCFDNVFGVDITGIGRLFRYFSYVLLIMLVCYNLLKHKEYFIRCIFLLVYGFWTIYVSDDTGMLVLALVLIAAMGTNFKKTLRIAIIAQVLSLVVVLMSYGMGWTSAVTYLKTGQSFGFLHPNILGNCILCLVLSLTAYYWNRLGFIYFGGVVAVIIIDVIFIHSRSSVFSLALCLMLVASYKNLHRIINLKRVFRNLFAFGFIAIIIGIFGIMFFYDSDNHTWSILNALTSTRVGSVYNFYQRYGLSLFGQDIGIVTTTQSMANSTKAYVLDNSYAFISLKYGLIPFICFIYLYFRSIVNNARINIELSIVLAVLAFHGFFESTLYVISYNVFLIYFSQMIFPKAFSLNSMIDDTKQ